MKTINLFSNILISSIASLVWRKKVISRVDIANTLGVDKSTVTKYVTRLLENNIIKEVAEGKVGPQGGRKPILLEINAKFGCVGGLEVNSEKFLCLLLDMHGNLLFKKEKRFSPEIFSFLGIKGIFEYVYEILIEESKRLKIPLLVIGAGMPGVIDSDNGIIKQSMSLLVNSEYAFCRDLEKSILTPVYINNDARCCCAAEKLIMRDSPCENALFLLLEYRLTEPYLSAKKSLSVGIGFVLNNKIYSGSDFYAGEFRSILWKKEDSGQFSSRVDLLDNPEESTISFDTASVELAKHIAFLVNMLNLENVYISGDSDTSMESIQEQIKDQIEYLFPYQIKERCEVRSSSFEELSVAYGAAAMCLENLFIKNDEKLNFANF